MLNTLQFNNEVDSESNIMQHEAIKKPSRKTGLPRKILANYLATNSHQIIIFSILFIKYSYVLPV